MPSRREELLVEIGLVDRGAGKTVFDMHVDVVLSQAEPCFLPLGIDRHQAAAGIAAGGHQRRMGGGHQLAGPLDGVRRTGRGRDVGRARRRAIEHQLLAGQDGQLQVADCNLALGDLQLRALGGDADVEFRAQGDHLPLGSADDEACRGRVLGDLDVDLPAAERHFPRGGERDGRITVKIQDRAVGQGEPPPLVAACFRRLADLAAFRQRPRPLRSLTFAGQPSRLPAGA